MNKFLHRQISENDVARNHLEKILRNVNKLTVVNGTDMDKFTDTTKREIQESVRAALLQNMNKNSFCQLRRCTDSERLIILKPLLPQMMKELLWQI